ncbi:MAG: xanthine dehydrogenase family protein molybdopterin-binding subunit [Beijerinckiaceae bacterium]|nr:xanthine dehydrogenase family protein molybdopterin-binding subunit [Beijerinckiaceae bacterium]
MNVLDRSIRAWRGRYEDGPLLRGEGHYSDDHRASGALQAVFVRSPHAHARVVSVDASEALASAGVVAVLTGADFAGLGYGPVTASIPFPGIGGKMPVSPMRPVLAGERVMHVGEPVAMVIAATRAQAQDAADLVLVEYEPLDPVIDLDQAAGAAVTLWPQAPGNVAHDWSNPPDADGAKRKALDETFAKAAHVVSVDVFNQRISAVSMEPRAATGSYDAQADRFTLHTGTQGVAGIRGQVAMCMKIEPAKLRVLTDDVGGGFGMKASSYPEYPALLTAAKLLGKPVHWAATRSESFMSDNQARDSQWNVDLALDGHGKFLALRVKGHQNVGAYLTGVAVLVPTVHIAFCLPGLYDIPQIVVDATTYFSNTVPTGPYRGAGRPEANYLLERAIEAASRKLAIDPAELRRRNLIAPTRMPYATATGQTVDSGDFPAIFEQALAEADYAGFPARRADAAKRGKLRGIGVSGYLEISGGHYHEPARINFEKGKVVLSIGPASNGQGHATVFRQLIADRLGLADDNVIVTAGDSDRDVPGFGAVASRSAMLVGSAIAVTSDRMIEKATGVATTLLQAGEGEVEYRNGAFELARTGQRVTLFEAAERASEMAAQGVLKENLDTASEAHIAPTFPNGVHVAEVEIDPDTGAVELVRYTAVGDCGVVLNETIVTGQVQGGVAQGIGQALGEFSNYDSGSGQLLAGSFMDYVMPRADHLPNLKVIHHPVPCTTNPIGVKGTGEAGTTAAPPTIVNAIENAISPQRALKLDMPLTPQKIWDAIRQVKDNAA